MTGINKSVHRQTSNEFVGDFAVVGAILQRSGQFFEEIRNGIGLSSKIVSLLISSTLFLLIYGAVLGSGHPLQAISSAIKFPLLFFGSLIACTPTLYIFDVLLGSKRSLGQTVAILLTAVTVIAVLLFGFAPITVVFKLTVNGFQFFKLLNVGFLVIAVIVGLIYLERGLRRTVATENHYFSSEVLYAFWIIILIIVISQMAWSLRPFFHYPGTDFTLFVGSNNVFTQIGSAIGEFLGFWVVR